MSSHKRGSNGLNSSNPSKHRCVRTENKQSITITTSKKNINNMSPVEVMETPDKSENDKKSYRVIRLENGLKALLISDPTQKCTLHDEPDNGSKCEAVTSSDDDEEETDSEQSDNEMENDSNDEKRGKLAACSLCVDVGSFSDPRDVQGLAHFLGKHCFTHFNAIIL